MAGRQRGGSGRKGTPGPDEAPEEGYGYGYGPPDREQGEAVEAHAEFVARHFGGGVEATPDLLDRALEVWQRLPGAVVRSPAQIRPNRPATGNDDEGTTS